MHCFLTTNFCNSILFPYLLYLLFSLQLFVCWVLLSFIKWNGKQEKHTSLRIGTGFIWSHTDVCGGDAYNCACHPAFPEESMENQADLEVNCLSCCRRHRITPRKVPLHWFQKKPGWWAQVGTATAQLSTLNHLGSTPAARGHCLQRPKNLPAPCTFSSPI